MGQSERAGRKFTDEFKRDAVELVRTSGKPIAEIGRELGIQLRELERDNARLRKERDLLKRATAFWVRESTQ